MGQALLDMQQPPVSHVRGKTAYDGVCGIAAELIA